MRFKEKNLSSFEDQRSRLESLYSLPAMEGPRNWPIFIIPPLPLKDIKPGLFRLNDFPSHIFEAVPTCCPEGGVVFPPLQCIDHQGHLYISCTIASEQFNIVAFHGFLYFISSCHGHYKGNRQDDSQVHGNSIVTGKNQTVWSQ